MADTENRTVGSEEPMEDEQQDVSHLAKSMQHFGWLDFCVFTLMLASCALIGMYFGYAEHTEKQKNKLKARRGSVALNYLVGGRKMQIFPVSVSLVASWISGITLLGSSTEIYLYGTQYMYIFMCPVIMGFIIHYCFLPVFHDLQLTSTYEYLQARYNKAVRIFGSFSFIFGLIVWMPIVIYVPALAFNQVTGINIHVVTPIVCVVCIFYTLVGGLKAVVWTDVIQTFIMVGAMLVVVFKGTADVGGFGVVWDRNFKSGRIEAPIFDTDPTMRHTFWTLLIGGSIFWVNTNAINQNMMQRYLSLPSLLAARKALWCFVFGTIFVISICCYNGLLIGAFYHDCDPLTTGLAKAKDQVVPLLVMDTLGGLPGLPGIFVAGVFSAALSSLSTGLNSLAAVILEDFVKPFISKPLSEKQTAVIMRSTVLFFGIVSVILVSVVEKLGSVLQLSMSVGAISLAPLLGIFVMGMFMPWINSKAALIGGVCSFSVMATITLMAQTSIASGSLSFQTKPMSVEGCTYTFPNVTKPTVTPDFVAAKGIQDMSYLYYTPCGMLLAILFANIACLFVGRQDPNEVDSALLAPFVRRMIERKLEPTEQAECIVHTFEVKDTQIKVDS